MMRIMGSTQQTFNNQQAHNLTKHFMIIFQENDGNYFAVHLIAFIQYTIVDQLRIRVYVHIYILTYIHMVSI